MVANILSRLRASIFAQFIMAKLEAQVHRVAAERLALQLRQRSDCMGRAVSGLHFDAQERVRIENENARLRGSLRAIAAGADEPQDVAVRALGDAQVDAQTDVAA